VILLYGVTVTFTNPLVQRHCACPVTTPDASFAHSQQVLARLREDIALGWPWPSTRSTGGVGLLKLTSPRRS
jgi:hypothetical protein